MAILHNKLKLYLEENSKTEAELYNGNILLANIGSGDYIEIWNVDGLTKPTDSEIASYETAANTEETNNSVRATRKKSYGNIGDQLDLLYKDMLSDKGDKTGEWFKTVKAVKDANPKD